MPFPIKLLLLCHAQTAGRADTDAVQHTAGEYMQVQNPEELWGNSFGRQGRGTAGSGGSDSAGQVCASILVKLMIDLYLKAGPAVAYPLALLMLQRCASVFAGNFRSSPDCGDTSPCCPVSCNS